MTTPSSRIISAARTRLCRAQQGRWRRTSAKQKTHLRSGVMSTHVRRRSWDQVTRSCRNMKLSNESGQTPTTTSFTEDSRIQATKPQRKRTSDGSIKDGQPWRMDDLRSALLQACNDVQNDKTRLRMDADMLMRRIAAIEAQERSSNSATAPSRQIATEARRLEGQQQVRRSGVLNLEAEQNKNMLEWHEVVLR